MIGEDPKNQATRAALARLAEPAARQYLAQIKAGENPWNTLVPSKVSAQQVAATPVPAMLVEPYLKSAVVLVFVVDLHAIAAMDQHLIASVSAAHRFIPLYGMLLGARNAGFGGTITTLLAWRRSRKFRNC
ncbi:MAG: hypothetical protein IPN63_06890 [Gammaproteobacteria bacterium]|nr:hypothetical protein [Gammaproteobacteria bacterium]